MTDLYALETVSDTKCQFGDALGTAIHGGATFNYTLQHPPSNAHRSFLIVQTQGAVQSRDNPVLIVQAPSGGAPWVLIGHLTPGNSTHVVEIGAPATLPQSFQVNIQTRSPSGARYGDPGLAAGGLDDFAVTSIQVLYHPK